MINNDPRQLHAQDLQVQLLTADELQEINELNWQAVQLALPGDDDPADTSLPPADLLPSTDRVWAAVAEHQIVGLAQFVHVRAGVAKLRQIQCASWYPLDHVLPQLLHATTQHCHRFGYLKLLVDASLDNEEALELMQAAGLRFTRRRETLRRPVLEFYVDLYHRLADDRFRRQGSRLLASARSA